MQRLDSGGSNFGSCPNVYPSHTHTQDHVHTIVLYVRVHLYMY